MKTKSFTLIELLVVIVIIGILAGVIIVSTSSSISKANFAKGISAGISKNYNDGNWHHIVGTFNGTVWKIYGDGSLDVSLEDACTLESSDYPLYIGARDYNYSFYGGSIDDVRIYNTALSSSQIKQEYIAGLNSLLANNNISKEEYLSRIENLSLND